MVCTFRHKERAMIIIELGKITLETRGGGINLREASGNHCLITHTDFPDQAC
jgi:hypothetical protein